ncbi:MAG: integrase domain-containing protein [Thiotrichales bacterium]|jgi:hypothetical protein|nr:integrase domain-containing protein [Thiotrichales bacterium]
MTRNFGAGTRDMQRAGAYFANKASESYSSQATLKQRFGNFVAYLKSSGIKRLEQVTKEMVTGYAIYLKENTELSTSTKHNLLSAVNIIMRTARQDNKVTVTAKEIDIERRNNVATSFKGDVERGVVSERVGLLIELARSFGLRFEEASKLNASVALKQAITNSEIKISLGTKGGQTRILPITSGEQLGVLKKAATIQGTAKSLIDPNLSYKEHKAICYRETSNFHSERHFYANERYSALIKDILGIDIKSPVLSDKPSKMKWRDYIAHEAARQGVNITPDMARDFDREARLKLSKELGHHREDVVSRYIGGQR